MSTETLAQSPQRKQKGNAFTLIELLIVVAIIAILASVAFPALKRSTESAKTAKCLTNLKQLGQATLAYNADNQQSLPPAAVQYSVGGMTFWYLEIRPYLGTTNVKLPTSTRYPQGRNLDVFYCPSVKADRAYPHTHYACNNNVFENPSTRTNDIIPQTRFPKIERPAKIVMLSESLGGGSTWPESTWQFPANVAKGNPDPWFPHRHGETVNMVFCDGHAQNLPRSEVVKNFTNYFGDTELWKP